MLQQEQQNRDAAGVGGKPVSMPIPSFQANVPTLTSAQFAALVGDQAENPPLADADDGAAADPQAVARSVSRVTPPLAATPAAPALKLTGWAAQPTASQAAAQAGTQLPADTGEDAPVFTRASQPMLIASAAAPAPASDAAPSAHPATDPTAAATKDAATKDAAKTPPPDPNVVHLRDAPDRETQRNLMAQHKRWVVDETPGARQLFFGADGVFGWDDFLDVINPLQHIPIVAQIYRAVTGDEINGAAELIGSLPLGPLGVIGMMGTVADLAVKDTTGKDIGQNLEAMVFGNGNGKKSADGTAADGSDMAEASPVHPDLEMQTASAEQAGGIDAERQAHDQRRA
jgi:hypothetical protein